MSRETYYQSGRTKLPPKDTDVDIKQKRQKDCLVLCMQHLISNGYFEAAERLSSESNTPLDKYELCDNISLESIVIEFETFQELKYSTKPRISKPNPKAAPAKSKIITPIDSKPSRTLKKPTTPNPLPDSTKQTLDQLRDHSKDLGKDTGKDQGSETNKDQSKTPINLSRRKEAADVRLLKPIPPQLRSEYGELVATIARDIFIDDTGVKWSDIVGLHDAKRVLREAVVMPLKYPQLFSGKKLLSPWKGVLLHGPPGTGKTLLAKAVAGEGTTFFNVSTSTLVSKWRGDSEKLIRVLFELARYHAPSTIFIDELDSIMSKRSSHDEHEASRRMKTEMLTQMDGLVQSDSLVFVLAASNFPFDLDPALLRRLEKRILVPLPEVEARKAMFTSLLTDDIVEPGIDFSEFAERTNGYSGSDIRLVCKEAAMEPLRRLMTRLQEKYGDDYIDIAPPEEVQTGFITKEDIELALQRTSPSAVYDSSVYEQWQKKFGVS